MEISTMKCTNCGKENDGNNNFCLNCGTKLDTSEVPNTKGAFINLSCPSCGGKLQITNDLDRFACGYCGREHIVIRSGGIVSLSPVVDSLKGIKVGVDRTASELAIIRLEQEISVLLHEASLIEIKIKNSLNWFNGLRFSDPRYLQNIKPGMHVDIVIKVLESNYEQIKEDPGSTSKLSISDGSVRINFEGELNNLKLLVKDLWMKKSQLKEMQSQLKKHHDLVSQ